MKAYRIAWLSFLEDETALEGRSLLYANSEHEAIQQLIVDKTAEYSLHVGKIHILSIVELPHFSNEKSES